MTLSTFKVLMQTIADGWNEGNPRKSLECFNEEAEYMEPPDKQYFKGASELYEYFGGDEAKTGQMKLTWHNLFFNDENQTGGGEYTFEMNNIIHHGVAVVEIENDKIKKWREYDTKGPLTYEDFINSSKEFKYTIKQLKS